MYSRESKGELYFLMEDFIAEMDCNLGSDVYKMGEYKSINAF